MTILLSDPAVGAVPVVENHDPLIALPVRLSPARCRVRRGLAGRLVRAAASLPAGIELRVVEGHRPAAEQQAIIDRYTAQVRAHHPHARGAELEALVSRFVSPLAVAPHVAGAAVDLTLVGPDGPLDLGTEIDATPEQSGGRCFTASTDIDPVARQHRELLGVALGGAGLVNYPTEWWHWSWGDRYWALTTGAGVAPYGPLDATGRPLHTARGAA